MLSYMEFCDCFERQANYYLYKLKNASTIQEVRDYYNKYKGISDAYFTIFTNSESSALQQEDFNRLRRSWTDDIKNFIFENFGITLWINI